MLENTPILKKKPIVEWQKSDIGKFNPADIKIADFPIAPLMPKPVQTTPSTPLGDFQAFTASRWLPQAPVAPQKQLQTGMDYLSQEKARLQQLKQTTTYTPPAPWALTGTPQQVDSTVNLALVDLKQDIDKWMPVNEFFKYYPEIPQDIANDLYTDIQKGMPIWEAKNYYPELQGMQPNSEVPTSEQDRYKYNAFEYANKWANYLQEQAENIDIPVIEPLAQWAASVLQLGTKWLRDITQWWAELLDKWIASQTDGKEMYKWTVSENLFDITQWFINTAASVVAPVYMLAFGTAMNSLPEDTQVKVGTLLNDMWSFVSKTPWLKQARESLPENRRLEFDQEVSGAIIGLLLGTKWKKNLVANPKKFFAENLNPINIMKNIEQNVLNIPWKVAKAWQPIIEQGKKIIKEEKVKMDTNAEAKKNAIVMKDKSKKWQVEFTDRLAQAQFWVDAKNVRTARENPDLFKQIDDWVITPETVKEELMSLWWEIKGKKWEAGDLYKQVYENPAQFDSAEVADSLLAKLKDKWVRFDENGKITWYDSTKNTYTNTEFSAIKDKFNNLITDLKENPRMLWVEEMHNVRKDIYNTSYQDWLATKKAKGMDILSNEINDKYLKQIPWFSEIDDAFKEASDIAKEVNELVFNRKQEFRWALKSLLNESQYKRLEKLEEYVPWITKKIETLVAHDDFKKAQDTAKVWLYNKWVAWAEWAIIGTIVWWPWIWTFLWSLAGTALSTYISNPKFLKQWIIKNAGKEVATKVLQGKKLSKLEQAKLQVAIKTAKVAEVKAEFEEYKKQTWNTKGMALPEKTTNNIGTPRNPIVAWYTPWKWLKPKLQAREIDTTWLTKIASNFSDAPKIWYLTAKWKVTDVTHNWWAYPTYRVKIDWGNWEIARDIDIYKPKEVSKGIAPKTAEKQGSMVEKTANKEQSKWLVQNTQEKATDMGLKVKEDMDNKVMPRDMPQEPMPIKNKLQEIKNAKWWTQRKEMLSSIQKEYWFKIDDLSVEDMDKLAKALHANTKVDTQIQIIEEIAKKYGKGIKAKVVEPVSNDLLQEAKKYKTAEEFVDANTNNYFTKRWNKDLKPLLDKWEIPTRSPIKTEWDMGILYRVSPEWSLVRNGEYLSTSKKWAKQYLKNAKENWVKNATIIEVRKPLSELYIDNQTDVIRYDWGKTETQLRDIRQQANKEPKWLSTKDEAIKNMDKLAIDPTKKIDEKWLRYKTEIVKDWIKKTETTNNPMQAKGLPTKSEKGGIMDSMKTKELTLYHGTKDWNTFNKFDISKWGKWVWSNVWNQWNQIYLTESEAAAKYFGKLATERAKLLEWVMPWNEKGNVLRFKLSKDAKILDLDTIPNWREWQSIIQKAKKDWYDAVRFPDKAFDNMAEWQSKEWIESIYKDWKPPRTTVIINEDKLQPVNKLDSNTYKNAKEAFDERNRKANWDAKRDAMRMVIDNPRWELVPSYKKLLNENVESVDNWTKKLSELWDNEQFWVYRYSNDWDEWRYNSWTLDKNVAKSFSEWKSVDSELITKDEVAYYYWWYGKTSNEKPLWISEKEIIPMFEVPEEMQLSKSQLRKIREEANKWLKPKSK